MAVWTQGNCTLHLAHLVMDYSSCTFNFFRKALRRHGQRLKTFWLYAIVGLTSAVCYVNNIYGDFVHDDIKAIKTNPDVRGERPLSVIFGSDFWGRPMSDSFSHKSYRPLCVLTFRLNNVIAPGNPVGYHIINNLLHGIVSMLFTHYCRLVIFTGDVTLSGIAGLLFTVHPIHTEAVSGLVGRAEVLCSLFYLISLITYHRAFTLSSSTEGSLSSLAWPVFYAMLALMCKEQGVTALGVCIAYEAFIIYQSLRVKGMSSRNNCDSYVTNNYDFKKNIQRLLWLSFSALVLIAFRLWMLNGSFPKFQEEDNPASFSSHLLKRILTYSYIWAFNVWLILCPTHLSHDWQMGSIPLIENVWDARNVTTLFLVYVMWSLTRLTLNSRKVILRQRVFFGLTLTVFPFLLVCNVFVTVGFVVAERVLYLPSMGVIILVTTGLDIIKKTSSKHGRLWKIWLVVILIVTPAYRTVIRNQVWMSRESLAKSGMQTLPHNAKMHYNYANVLATKGDILGAVDHYRKAISLWPKYVSAHNNLAHYLTNETEALIHLTEVIRLHPCHTNAYTNIAKIYHRTLNDTDTAINMLKFAARCEETSPAPYLCLASIYQDAREIKLAEIHYKRALQLAPEQADVHYNLGLFYDKQGRLDLAVRYLEKGMTLDPLSLPNLQALARVYTKVGRIADAESCFTKILQIRRDQTTLDMAGIFYFNTGKAFKAIELFNAAYILKPTETLILHLSQALASLRMYDEAEFLLKKHMNDRHISLLTQLANVYGLQGAHKKAVYLLTELIKTQQLSAKQLSVVHLQIGNHLKDIREWYLAFKNFYEAVHFDADNAESHHNLAVCFHRQGMYRKAVHHYEAALVIRPDDQLLQRNYKTLLGHRHILADKEHSGQREDKRKPTAIENTAKRPSRLLYLTSEGNATDFYTKSNIFLHSTTVEKMTNSLDIRDISLDTGQQPP